jgi:CRP-like cAMP-binding protein
MKFRNLALSRLDPTQLARMIPFLDPISLKQGQLLYEAGAAVEAVYFPTSAAISLVSEMRDGRSVEAATIGFESVVGTLGALCGEPSHARVFVQVAGGAVKLKASRLRELVDASPSLLKLLLRHAHEDASQAERSVACNALHPVPQRLAKWLLLTHDRIDGGLVPLTQEYLSIMLGVQRTTVTDAAKALKAAGLIRYLRGNIEILDRGRLERAACECYAACRAVQPAPQGRPAVSGASADA